MDDSKYIEDLNIYYTVKKDFLVINKYKVLDHFVDYQHDIINFVYSIQCLVIVNDYNDQVVIVHFA